VIDAAAAVAALPVLIRDERNGTVFVQDERPDGTLVVLQCSEGGGSGGVAARSQVPDERVWPMALRMEDERPILEYRLGTDFILTLDTSGLPAGRLEFDTDRFVEHVQIAVEEGQSVVHLDGESAAEWGLRLREEGRD
jgi:hypothetical protein